jgi:hypothetical protein
VTTTWPVTNPPGRTSLSRSAVPIFDDSIPKELARNEANLRQRRPNS